MPVFLLLFIIFFWCFIFFCNFAARRFNILLIKLTIHEKVANIILLTLLLLITGAAPVLAEKELPIELQKLADEAYRSYSERETDNFFEYYQSHDLQTAEIKAKQAIRERITSPWQRSFSQNQRIDLGYYAGIFSDVIPS